MRTPTDLSAPRSGAWRRWWIAYRRCLADRFVFRLAILLAGVISLAFWSLALITGSWLWSWGYGWVAWTLLALWSLLALPSFMLHLAMVLDVMNYWLTGRVLLYPFVAFSGNLAKKRESSLEHWLLWPMFVAQLTLPTMWVALMSEQLLRRVPRRAYAIPLADISEAYHRKPATPWQIATSRAYAQLRDHIPGGGGVYTPVG